MRTELHTACATGNEELARELLLTNPEWLNEATAAGLTPLMLAVQYGHVAIVRWLVQEDGIVVDQPASRQWTALRIAVNERRAEIVKILVAAGAEPKLKASDGDSPVDVALRRNQLGETIEILKALGKDASPEPWQQLIPLPRPVSAPPSPSRHPHIGVPSALFPASDSATPE